VKVLAIDTATERCSVALLADDRIIERAAETPRGHAELVLPMVEAVLQESGLRLQQLDGLAYGRGPGAFTGVRIAVGVAQGLAYGARLVTVGISDLAAVAQQIARAGDRILVCMDARMGEVYWGTFQATAGAPVVAIGGERVDRPEAVVAGDASVFAGTGFKAYPQLTAGRNAAAIHDAALPHARDIARLAVPELLAGRGQPAQQAQPVYLRDQVVAVKSP
jgi:tRNA threonylcarbamoyladenosine biosynthesis protein TsaB